MYAVITPVLDDKKQIQILLPTAFVAPYKWEETKMVTSYQRGGEEYTPLNFTQAQLCWLLGDYRK